MARVKEALMKKTNRMRILILLSLALGFLFGRKAFSSKVSAVDE